MDCRFRIVYECKLNNHVFYILLVESILGKLKLPVVSVGDTGTIVYPVGPGPVAQDSPAWSQGP